MDSKYAIAVQTIKSAILQSQYMAIKLVNKEQLALYYGIGRYISQNSRQGYWGTAAIKVISMRLQAELPGLRGFSERNLKNMRTFYEEWQALDSNSAVATAELQSTELQGNIPLNEIRQLQLPNFREFPVEEFFRIGFTHHTAILSMVKEQEQRYFYIKLCANECLKVEALKLAIKQDLYNQKALMPNNFLAKLPSTEFARRAIMGHTHIIDLLFFNRELSSLVAIELKTGNFKPAYLGQLNMYLQVLDDYVRKPNENPSIGIILCKTTDKAYVEYAVRDYDKPMGVATYKTATDMPERLRNSLPDQEALLRLMESEQE